MKMQNKMRLKIGMVLTLIFAIILSVQTVSAFGITEPLPVGLRLLRGDAQRLYFQIQAVTSTEDLKCTYSVSGLESLIISFDKGETTVKAGEIKNVYATISVPEDAAFKTYSGELAVSCSSVRAWEGETSGSSVQPSLHVGFNVQVVETLEERRGGEIPEKIPSITYIETFAIIIIILVVAGVIYLFSTKFYKKPSKK